MPFDRRHFLNICSAAGLAGTLLPGALYTLAAQAEQQGSESQKQQPITSEVLRPQPCSPVFRSLQSSAP